MEIQFKFISKYGFSPDNQGKLAFRFASGLFRADLVLSPNLGLINFTNKIKDLSIEDDNVAGLFDNFKNLLIPPLNLRTQCV